ncbi:MAG TPA: nucleoside recognition protein [Desulfotignum sp.]|nr:nucleoside recognition protein [Desulfotignum sp.]
MKHRQPRLRLLCISAGISALLPLASSLFIAPVTMDILVKRLLFPLGRLTGFIGLGLAAGQIIEGFGWTRQVAVVARPFFRFSRMGDRCSAAFTTAFFSGAAANAMLAEFYDQGKISKLQLFLSNYINQFPAFFLHLPTTVFIVLPLTGMAGALYFLLTFLAVFVRTIGFLVVGRFFLEKFPAVNKDHDSAGPLPEPGKKSLAEIIQAIGHRLPIRLVNIFIWVLPIYTLVFLLHWHGGFDLLNTTLSRYVAVSLMPVESLSVVILSFAAEFTSGFAAAGALMNAGVLTIKQTVLALLLGNILAFPIRALRHQLPRYLGIFSPKIGLQLLLSGQAFRVVSIMLIGTIYYLVV